MEGPWVILGRVIRGVPVPNNVEAVAEQAAAAVDAQDQHAAAVDAPAEDIGALDADAEAQPEHAAAAADGAEAQHQAEHVAAVEPDITVAIALPRRVTILAAGREAYHEPGPVCLLAHFSVAPFRGAFLGFHPHSSHPVLVRDFHTAGGQTTATAERVIDRPGSIPLLQHILNLLLDSNNAGDYLIADLNHQAGVDRATYARFSSAHGQWFQHNHYITEALGLVGINP